MIYDTLNNLPNYLGVSDNLDTVIEYIMARDITTLPAGRTHIDGEKAVVTVSTVTPQTSDKALFQRHDQHITLETDLDGSELFEVSLAELTPTKPADEASDTTVGTAGTSIAGMLCEGRYALQRLCCKRTGKRGGIGSSLCTAVCIFDSTKPFIFLYSQRKH